MQRHAKTLPVFLVFSGIILGLSGTMFAQRVVPVEPGFATLNDAIDGDTLSDGSRRDPNTIYELQRGPGAIYLLDGSIRNSQYPLTIAAQEGEGERPRLIPAVGGGGESSRPFRPAGDLTLRGLYVTNKDEIGGINTNMIRVSADSARIVVEDCQLDIDAQAAFRLDNAWIRIFLTNSIVSNIGGTDSPDNGRGIDDRGNPADTIWVENCTFYNLTSRALRDAGGIINYARFNHNTLVNIGQYGVTFGEVQQAVFTNNLVINAGFYGHDSTDHQLVAVDSLIEGGGQAVAILNNNFYLDPQLIAAYPADSVMALPNFNATAQAFIDQEGTANTIIEEAITFANAPAPPVDVVTAFWTDPGSAQPPLDTAGEPFDFSYSTSTQSYTFGTDDLPLGDVSWHGLGPIGISDPDVIDNTVPASFQLRGNYPNPFNPETTIEYSVSRLSQVRINIYNMLGQKVRTLVNNLQQNPGTYAVRWDGTDDHGQIVSSGIYFYRLETPYFNRTRRMLLMK